MATKAELEQRINDLETKVEDILIDLGVRERDVRDNNFEICNRVWKLENLVGPAWTTQAGHRRALGAFSTEHLENLVNGQWLEGKFWHKKFAKEEIDRRRIDAEHRKKPSLWKRFWAHALGSKV